MRDQIFCSADLAYEQDLQCMTAIVREVRRCFCTGCKWGKNDDVIFLVKPEGKRKGKGKADFSYWKSSIYKDPADWITNLPWGFGFEYKCDDYLITRKRYGEPEGDQEERDLTEKIEYYPEGSDDRRPEQKGANLVRIQWEEAEDFLDFDFLNTGGGAVTLSFYDCSEGGPEVTTKAPTTKKPTATRTQAPTTTKKPTATTQAPTTTTKQLSTITSSTTTSASCTALLDYKDYDCRAAPNCCQEQDGFYCFEKDQYWGGCLLYASCYRYDNARKRYTTEKLSPILDTDRNSISNGWNTPWACKCLSEECQYFEKYYATFSDSSFLQRDAIRPPPPFVQHIPAEDQEKVQTAGTDDAAETTPEKELAPVEQENQQGTVLV
ncbi:unnamed protein product [Amoebophrya sp. A120]|nr:unnamed protein product [Amoebophrya sp. A120]|eukprot:GSA120T00009963001.1